MAKKVVLSSLIIELDCKEVELVNNTKDSKATIHWIVSNIHYLKREFQNVKFLFVPRRNCNAHAHSVAKFALENDTSAVWKDTIPANIHIVLDTVGFS